MAAETTPHAVKVGQVYESCQATFVVDGVPTCTRIVVKDEPGFFGKVMVATLTEDGREVRRRAIECSQLHASGLTREGLPRRTGYRLVKDVT